MSLFKQRKQEHRQDAAVRDSTAETLIEHRKSLSRVRKILGGADETLAQEIRRLDAVLERNQ